MTLNGNDPSSIMIIMGIAFMGPGAVVTLSVLIRLLLSQ